MARGPSPSPPNSFPRTLLALLLAGGLIALAGAAAFFLFTGGNPFSRLGIASQTSLVRELPPGEPTLSPGIVQSATPSPTASKAAASPSPTRPKATPTPLEFSIPTETPRAVAPATAPATVPANQTAPRAIVKGDVVNVRGGPGTNYPVLGQVKLGQIFEAIARTNAGDWLEICCPVTLGETGWISAPLMTMTSAIDALPVGSIPPTPESVAVAPVAAAPVLAASQAGSNPAATQAQPSAGLPGPGGFGTPGETNPLTGLGLSPDLRGRRPLIVCINNDYAARPQYGTSQADVMYEYVMEGYGITRFSGVFYGESSTQIGPVRSARLINLSLGTLYDAGLVCSGASDGVRFPLKNSVSFPYLDIDLDDPSNSRYTVSIGSDYRTRLRTSTEGMRRWLADWGVEKAPGLRGFTFGNTPAGGAPASEISIPYPQATGSQVAYRYDAGSGRYLRFLGGAPHLDGNSGSQLALDNVIVQYVPHETTDIVEDSLGSLSIRLNLFGSGRALIFRNGLGYEGTWQSNSGGDMPRFFDGEGQEIPLKAGKSWISVVPLTYAIAYQ